jgi:hypothetical protein
VVSHKTKVSGAKYAVESYVTLGTSKTITSLQEADGDAWDRHRARTCTRKKFMMYRRPFLQLQYELL